MVKDHLSSDNFRDSSKNNYKKGSGNAVSRNPISSSFSSSNAVSLNPISPSSSSSSSSNTVPQKPISSSPNTINNLVTSLQNPHVKEVKKLRDRKDRKETGLFLVEGYKELTRAIHGGVAITTLFFCEELFLKTNEFVLIDEIKKKGAAIISCSKNVFEKIAYRERPDNETEEKKRPLFISGYLVGRRPGVCRPVR